jgi:UDP-glucose 4-epimerase
MNILLTGGLGYVGSHISINLLLSGYNVFIIDNLSNSKISVLSSIKKVAKKNVFFEKIDLFNKKKVQKFFENNTINLVIHLAGSKSVEESESNLMKYYNNNIVTSVNLLEAMNKNKVKNIIFSSSATVYGIPKKVPIKESDKVNPINTYGFTKSVIENLIIQMSKKNLLNYVILRYFNPAGLHHSGLILENPKGVPTNLFPFLLNVINGKFAFLKIFGNDYKTKDGTGARDYIHVEDLAQAHVKAIKLFKADGKAKYIFNIGTGKSTTVLEILNALKKYCNINIKYKFFPRRIGDLCEIYNNVTYAHKKLKWESKKTIKDICLSLITHLSKK